jgi:hypothetical protein
MQFLIPALIGLFSGVASGLFGVGGGIIMVPAMMFFMKMPIKQAIGTSLLVIIPTAMIGSFKHYQSGNVIWATALMLMPTAIGGGYLGSWLAHVISAGDLKKAFGGFLVLVGIRLLVFK